MGESESIYSVTRSDLNRNRNRNRQIGTMIFTGETSIKHSWNIGQNIISVILWLKSGCDLIYRKPRNSKQGFKPQKDSSHAGFADVYIGYRISSAPTTNVLNIGKYREVKHSRFTARADTPWYTKHLLIDNQDREKCQLRDRRFRRNSYLQAAWLRSRVLRVFCDLIKNVGPYWGGQNLTAVELSEYCSHMNSSLQCSPWSQDRLQ